MTDMSTISQAIRISVSCVIPLIVLWNIIVLIMLLGKKAILKRMREFCASALQATGTVNQLIKKSSAGGDSTDYYSSYLFYAENGESFTGSYALSKPEEYKKGLPVTVYYDRNNPSENVCVNQLAYEEKQIHVYQKLMPSGTLFLLGILILIFLAKLIF